MIDNVLSFILAGTLFSYIFISIIFLIGAVLDHKNYSKSAMVLTIISVMLVTYINSSRIDYMLAGGFGFIVVGFIWSILRWRIRINSAKLKTQRLLLKMEKEHAQKKGVGHGISFFINADDERIKEINESIIFSKNIGSILSWVFSWPASLVGSVAGAIYDEAEIFLREKLGGVYKKISEKGVSDINDMISNFNKIDDSNELIRTVNEHKR